MNQQDQKILSPKSVILNSLSREANIKLSWIPPGQFIMGSPESEVGRRTDETEHSVILTKGFWLGQTPVTQIQWIAVMGDNNPSHFNIKRNSPVDSVTWEDTMNFCRKLNTRTPSLTAPGWKWTIPTESQWEYACRSGASTSYQSNLDTAAWYEGNSDETQNVASKTPNAWDLYDMHGNVTEWCRDWYGEYSTEQATDPRGPRTRIKQSYGRVYRGGSWASTGDSCRSASRSQMILNPPSSGFSQYIASSGFRLALVEPSEVETIWYQNEFDDPKFNQLLQDHLIQNMKTIMKGYSQFKILDCENESPLKKRGGQMNPEGMLRLSRMKNADEMKVVSSGYNERLDIINRDVLFSRIHDTADEFRKMIFERDGI